jgi:hypothetical protein
MTCSTATSPTTRTRCSELLPEWAQWCIEQNGIDGDAAAPFRDAARRAASALAGDQDGDPDAEDDEAPFRCPELRALRVGAGQVQAVEEPRASSRGLRSGSGINRPAVVSPLLPEILDDLAGLRVADLD